MQGISRYIMDAKAFARLEDAFIHQDPVSVRRKIQIEHLNTFNNLWSGFMAMLRLDRFQVLREKSFMRLRNQISAVGLSKDQIIPARSILRTLGGADSRNKIPMSILDFPYPYSHENPFPISHPELHGQVTKAFNQVFRDAAKFLG
jgi:hypothetical protein